MAKKSAATIKTTVEAFLGALRSSYREKLPCWPPRLKQRIESLPGSRELRVHAHASASVVLH